MKRAMFALIVLAACGKGDGKKAKAEERAKINEQIKADGTALIEKAKAIAKAPAAGPAAPLPPDQASFITNTVLVSSDAAETDKAIDLKTGAKVYFKLPTDEIHVAEVVSGKEEQLDDSADKWIKSVKYVLVLRSVSHDPPKMVDATKFEPGQRTVEARLYELATAKYIGGQVVKVTNSTSVADSRPKSVDALEDDIETNFDLALSTAMRKGGGTPLASPPQ